MDLLLQKKRVPRELVRVVQGVVLAVALARRGLRKKSLSKSGAAAGALVAAVTWSSGPRFGLTLIAFYQSGSFVTKIGSARKTRQDANATEAGERDAAQVLSCSLVAAVIALAYRVACGDDRPCTDEEGVCGSLIAAFVAFFGCCCGDTFASEIGSLATSEPRLITRPWQKVPPGTNGGVTILGTVASALGGLFIGIVHGIGGFFLERKKNSNNIFPERASRSRHRRSRRRPRRLPRRLHPRGALPKDSLRPRTQMHRQGCNLGPAITRRHERQALALESRRQLPIRRRRHRPRPAYQARGNGLLLEGPA